MPAAAASSSCDSVVAAQPLCWVSAEGPKTDMTIARPSSKPASSSGTLMHSGLMALRGLHHT